jgi:hypothetical protein
MTGTTTPTAPIAMILDTIDAIVGRTVTIGQWITRRKQELADLAASRRLTEEEEEEATRRRLANVETVLWEAQRRLTVCLALLRLVVIDGDLDATNVTTPGAKEDRP